MSYTFYDGPPFTSGDPHYGHLLQSIVKDMVPRRMTMRGYRVNRKRWWDCHGIPAENFVNKKLWITSKKQVEEEFGLQNYIEACRTMVNEVNTHRKRTVDHIGRWVDMENAYFTMDNNFMESVICLFSDLYHRNLIYKWFKVLGYSRALWTALSNSEIAEGYEMRQDPAVTVKLALAQTPIEVVCGVIKDDAWRTLMIYENRHNARYFPGGKIELWEMPADALKREIREELGVEVVTEHFLWHAKTIHKNKLYRLHYFEITVTWTPTIQEPHHHGMLEWITKILSENKYGYVLKFADNIIADEFALRHDFADIHMLEQWLIWNELSGDASVSILPWTTTPWTLPANMFAAVHHAIDYIQIFDITSKEYYVLAEACLSKYYKTADDYIEVGVFKGEELIGMKYSPLYSYYHDTEIDDSYKMQVHTILHADFVTTESGTGIVHEAPAFGADDYDLVALHLGRDNAQAWLFDPVNEYGEFTQEATDFIGINVFDANSEIIKELKSRGLLIKQETYNHSYPHCPRTKTPLIYKAIESRFVKEDDLKALTVPAAEQIHFVPETVKARFINGLASAPDRNISRTRYRWAPLPVWECASCGEVDVVWSISEIEQKSGQQVTDLHRPYIDDIVFPCACGATKKRIPEVLDCRFESGAMPYGQDHFMKKGWGEFSNCANFIAEWLDQTRWWFRALHVLGHAYHGQNVFQNVVVTWMILAEDGKKMSKSLQNYPDPTILINQYGADALRLYLLASPVVRAEPLRFSEKGVEQMLKDVVIPLQNVFNFFKMYAEADKRKDDGTQVWFMRHALKAKSALKSDDWDGESDQEKTVPLSEEGFAQLESQELIETIVRINPDVVVYSDFLRAEQTVVWVKKIVEQYISKEVLFEQEIFWGNQNRPDQTYDQWNTLVGWQRNESVPEISKIYKDLLKKHAGKRILIVSHKRRFRYLWQWLTDIKQDINTSEITKKYQPLFENPIPLPLTPIHNELDQWVLAESHRTIWLVDRALLEYRLEEATQHLVNFVEKVTNWYLRRSRRRFWTEAMTDDKQQAYTTLFTVLRTYLQLCAPFIPFVTEQLWQELSGFTMTDNNHPSVHLQNRPLSSPTYINQQLIEEVETVRKIIKWTMYLRAKHKVKVKQPLSELAIKL
jgi:isoleucyl-tRNA synthetase